MSVHKRALNKQNIGNTPKAKTNRIQLNKKRSQLLCSWEVEDSLTIDAKTYKHKETLPYDEGYFLPHKELTISVYDKNLDSSPKPKKDLQNDKNSKNGKNSQKADTIEANIISVKRNSRLEVTKELIAIDPELSMAFKVAEIKDRPKPLIETDSDKKPEIPNQITKTELPQTPHKRWYDPPSNRKIPKDRQADYKDERYKSKPTRSYFLRSDKNFEKMYNELPFQGTNYDNIKKDMKCIKNGDVNIFVSSLNEEVSPNSQYANKRSESLTYKTLGNDFYLNNENDNFIKVEHSFRNNKQVYNTTISSFDADVNTPESLAHKKNISKHLNMLASSGNKSDSNKITFLKDINDKKKKVVQFNQESVCHTNISENTIEFDNDSLIKDTRDNFKKHKVINKYKNFRMNLLSKNNNKVNQQAKFLLKMKDDILRETAENKRKGFFDKKENIFNNQSLDVSQNSLFNKSLIGNSLPRGSITKSCNNKKYEQNSKSFTYSEKICNSNNNNFHSTTNDYKNPYLMGKVKRLLLETKEKNRQLNKIPTLKKNWMKTNKEKFSFNKDIPKTEKPIENQLIGHNLIKTHKSNFGKYVGVMFKDFANSVKVASFKNANLINKFDNQSKSTNENHSIDKNTLDLDQDTNIMQKENDITVSNIFATDSGIPQRNYNETNQNNKQERCKTEYDEPVDYTKKEHRLQTAYKKSLCKEKEALQKKLIQNQDSSSENNSITFYNHQDIKKNVEMTKLETNCSENDHQNNLMLMSNGSRAWALINEKLGSDNSKLTPTKKTFLPKVKINFDYCDKNWLFTNQRKDDGNELDNFVFRE